MAEQSLLVIDSESRSTKSILEALTPLTGRVKVLGAVERFRDGLRLIGGEPPTIVILEAQDLERGAQEVSLLLSQHPQLSVFVTARVKDPEWILRLIRAGATEYLPRPVDPSDLVQAVQKVVRRTGRGAQTARKGRVISCYSPCAGMGTTTVAVNIAAALAAAGKKVVLADLNLAAGDIPTFLDLHPRYTVADVAAKQGQIDGSFLASVLVPSSGFSVLCGPVDPLAAEGVGADSLAGIISVLRTGFDYVIADTGGALSAGTLQILAASGAVLFTSVLSLPALRNGRRYLTALERRGIAKDRVMVVLNRYQPKDEIRLADAEKVLDRTVWHTIPNDYREVRSSINRGVPLVLSGGRSPVVAALAELGRKLVHPEDLKVQQEVI